MKNTTIDGVILSPLKRISHPKGEVMHAMKSSDPGYAGFGEAYFSTVQGGEVKGWKKHRDMTMNLVVPCGRIRFVIIDDRAGSSVKRRVFETVLSKDNYFRLTVPPGVWMAFEGLDAEQNLLLNLASIEHEPTESENLPLDAFPYVWKRSE